MTFTVMTDDWKSDAVDHQGRLCGHIRPRERKLLIRLSGHLKKDSKDKDFKKGDIEDDICDARFERAAAKPPSILRKVFREEGNQGGRESGEEGNQGGRESGRKGIGE